MEPSIQQNKLQKIEIGSTSQILANFNLKTEQQTVLKVTEGHYNAVQKQCQILWQMRGIQGFPKIFAQGTDGNKKWIEMEKLGISVSKISFMRGAFTPDQAVNLGLQMLDLIERLHQGGFLHNDLKSQHFLFGSQESQNILYLIDFGMSQKIQDQQQNKTHKPAHRFKFKGNLHYSSVSCMKGHKSTIKDDLQSLVYIVAELIDGHLPWKNLSKQKTIKQHFLETLQKKEKNQGWIRYGWWVKLALKSLRKSSDPYYDLRTKICKLIDF